MPKMQEMTIKDIIWWKSALKEKIELEDKKDLILLDNRFLLKDISDVTRMKASGGKTTSIIKEKDLPSSRILNEGKELTTADKLVFLERLNERLNGNK